MRFTKTASQAVIFLSVALLAYLFGIRDGGDTPRYVGGALHLLAGQPLEGLERNHPAYITLLAFIQWLGLPAETMIPLHWCLCLFAGLLAFYVGTALYSQGVGLSIALFWLFFPDVQRWNAYVLTDGPANSLLLIAASLALLAQKKPRVSWLLLPCAVLMLLTRPGLSMSLIPIGFFLLSLRHTKLAGVGLVAIAFTFGFLRSTSVGESYEMTRHWISGTVVSGNLFLPPPGEILSSKTSFGFLMDAFLQYPVWFFRWMATKALLFVVGARPYYSTVHNVVLGTACLFTLAFAFAQTLRNRSWSIGLLLFGIFFFQCGINLMTFLTYDGRETSQVIAPLLFLATPLLCSSLTPFATQLRTFVPVLNARENAAR